MNPPGRFSAQEGKDILRGGQVGRYPLLCTTEKTKFESDGKNMSDGGGVRGSRNSSNLSWKKEQGSWGELGGQLKVGHLIITRRVAGQLTIANQASEGFEARLLPVTKSNAPPSGTSTTPPPFTSIHRTAATTRTWTRGHAVTKNSCP